MTPPIKIAAGHPSREGLVWEYLEAEGFQDVLDCLFLLLPSACEIRVSNIQGDPLMYLTCAGSRAQLTVFHPSSHEMAIANYLVSNATDSGSHTDLGWNSFPSEMVVDIELATSAARYFFDFGAPPEWATWKKEQIDY